MSTTREDREATALFYDGPTWRQYPFLAWWVERGAWPMNSTEPDLYQAPRERFAAALRAHREAAERATVERIADKVAWLVLGDTGISAASNIVAALSVFSATKDAVLRIVRGEAKGGE